MRLAGPPYPGGLVSSIAFLIEHPVALAEGDCRDPMQAPFGKVVEFSLAYPIDAEIATDPEIAARVFEYLENAILVELFISQISVFGKTRENAREEES